MAKLKSIKTRDFILESEKDSPDCSVFKIQDLNPIKAAEIYDILFENGTFNLTIRAFVKAAELGLIGWDNITDENDDKVNFSKHAIQLLPTNYLTEIGVEVLKNTFPEFEAAFNGANKEETPEVPLVD